MDASQIYDAKRAYHHVTQLAFPRLVGSTGETRAREYIVKQFTKCGLHVRREPFHFTKFPAEVLPRLLSAFFTLIVIAVPLLAERFPAAICMLCFGGLGVVMFFTRWQTWLEKLYDVGTKFRSENIVATNPQNPPGNAAAHSCQNHLTESADEKPNLIFIAHYDTKSQVLPIVVRAAAYGIAICGLMIMAIGSFVRWAYYVSVPLYIVWGIAGLTCFCLLLVQINFTQNRSPGGFDNASGVGVLLEVARVMMARGEKMRFTFLATGAEEYGMCGALRYVQTHAGKHHCNCTAQDEKNGDDETGTSTFIPECPEHLQHPKYVINLDGLGVGNAVGVVTRYGLPPFRTAVKLADALRASGQSRGIQITERYLPVGVGLDSIPIASRGLEAVTLTAAAAGTVALKVHSKRDGGELLNVESLQQVGELIVDVIERIGGSKRETKSPTTP